MSDEYAKFGMQAPRFPHFSSPAILMICDRVVSASMFATLILTAAPALAEIVLKGNVVDGDGRPVSGTDVGVHWQAAGTFQGPIPWRISDGIGSFEVPFRETGRDSFVAMALDEERKQAGLAIVHSSEAQQPASIRLQQALTLEGTAYCSEFQCRPQSMLVEVSLIPDSAPRVDESLQDIPLDALEAIDKAALPLLSSYGIKDGHFTCQLPAGRYLIRCNAGVDYHDCYQVITLSSQDRDVTLEMLPTQLARLYGKPAPTWHATQIRGLSDEASITDLHGKWVVLEFWSHSCGPCVTRNLPELMRFYEECDKDRDRFEVVAIHHGDSSTFDDLEQKTSAVREKYWGGKGLPFPVILDDTGQTATRYGITGLPTSVVIDPAGKVSRCRSLAQLKQILAGELTLAENLPVDVSSKEAPSEQPPPTVTPIAANHVKSDRRIQCVGHTQPVSDGAFAPDGKLLITGGCDGQLIAWNPASGQSLQSLQAADIVFSSTGMAVEFLPDGKRFVSLFYSRSQWNSPRQIAIYSLADRIEEGNSPTLALENPTLLQGSTGSADIIDVSADGKRVATKRWVESKKSYEVVVWSLDQGERLRSWTVTGGVKKLALSGDGNLLAIGSGGNSKIQTLLELRSVASGEVIWRHSQPGWAVTGIDFSSDDRQIVSVAWNESIHVRDTQTGDLMQTFRTPGHKPYCVAFSPDDAFLATGGTGPFNSVRLWDLKSNQLRATLIGHRGGEIREVCFSSDSRRLVSVGGTGNQGTVRGEGQVYVWDLSQLLPENLD